MRPKIEGGEKMKNKKKWSKPAVLSSELDTKDHPKRPLAALTLNSISKAAHGKTARGRTIKKYGGDI